MSYNSIAAAAQDGDLRLRIAACIAQEQPDGGTHPTAVADQIQWQVVSIPAISDAYAYGVNSNNPRPGHDEAVVTDAAILAAVDAIVNPAPVEGE